MMDKKNQFTAADYKIEKREVIYKGFYQYVLYQLRHRLFSGGWTPSLQREVMERTSAVAVLPYDPHTDRVVLISQFRPGALNNIPNPWLIEIIAGVYAAGEKPTEVALREAREEAGCQLSQLEAISDYFCSPGGTNEHLYIFCGCADLSQVGGIYGEKNENEDIYAATLTADEAFDLVRQHKIKTGPAVVSLLWLELNRRRLQEKWLNKS